MQITHEETSKKCSFDFTVSSQITDPGDPPLENLEGLDDQKQH